MAAEEKEQELSLFELSQKHFAKGRELLEQDLNNARQEKAAIEEKARQEQAAREETTKTLNKVHFASTIKLNVGGKIYKTTLDTLRKDPDSMLCAMFSGRFELKADEEDGAYFIDRDGKLFRYILNYLRNGELHCPEDRIRRNELLEEAKFYQVQGIIDQLEGSIEGSLIIKNKDHHSALISWLPPNTTCSLLYRSSTDGKTPADFHCCCDNKGPTLVLIKSGEYIFGGYTSESWETADSLQAIEDRQSFLFTLVNPSGNEPVKITQNNDACIRCSSSLEPTFGNTRYYDHQVWKDLSSNLDLGYGFKCPDNVKMKAFFTGGKQFTISELEVLQVNL
ncbi:uncharacterized protein LOC144638243 isoform X2 [Oculina patagonica]